MLYLFFFFFLQFINCSFLFLTDTCFEISPQKQQKTNVMTAFLWSLKFIFIFSVCFDSRWSFQLSFTDVIFKTSTLHEIILHHFDKISLSDVLITYEIVNHLLPLHRDSTTLAFNRMHQDSHSHHLISRICPTRASSKRLSFQRTTSSTASSPLPTDTSDSHFSLTLSTATSYRHFLQWRTLPRVKIDH